MPNSELEHKFYLAFTEWFKDSMVDFWSECDAPEQLASIAAEICRNEQSKDKQ